MSRWIYHLWMVCSTLSALASLLVAFYFYRARAMFGDTSRLGHYLVLAFVGSGVHALLTRLPVGHGFRFAGAIVEMVAIGALALYCLGFLNGKRGR